MHDVCRLIQPVCSNLLVLENFVCTPARRVVFITVVTGMINVVYREKELQTAIFALRVKIFGPR